LVVSVTASVSRFLLGRFRDTVTPLMGTLSKG
jgi:hypothetical protein